MNNAKEKSSSFHEEHVLHELAHYLPAQAPLKDFIHHNTLHAFQHEKFFDGIFRASRMFGFRVTLQLTDYRALLSSKRIKYSVLERIIIERKGKAVLSIWKDKLFNIDYDENINPRIGRLRSNWKKKHKIDLDSLVQPLLFRVLSSYLDQGISLWGFPMNKEGFLASIKSLEAESSVSLFRTKNARTLLQSADLTIEKLLHELVGEERYYEQYLFDMCFSHPGWSGMVAVLDDNPNAVLVEKPISLKDFILVELLMELDILTLELGCGWGPLSHNLNQQPFDVLSATEKTELDEVLNIWQDAFEWSYYDDILSGLKFNLESPKAIPVKKKFQAIFCIDERECSIRRHLEFVAPDIETFGAPGFFGVEFYYKHFGAKFNDKLCPAPITPKYLIKEFEVSDHRKGDIMFSQNNHSLFQGYFLTIYLGFLSIGKMFQTLFRPKMSASISDAFSHMDKYGKLSVENTSVSNIEDGLQVGFTISEMTIRVENFLRGIGLITNYSEIIYVVSHGSSSANNPHHGAHDCGACSGRPGCVNARVFSIMANHPSVREQLSINGIDIPASTIFIAAMHDTSSDVIGFYDDEQLTISQGKLHQDIIKSFEDALDLNAKERSRRFASINSNQEIKKIRKAIYKRSVSLFEPRPELGHGTNSLAIIGRRSLTRGLYMDRRAFLNSYDYSTDLNGKYLINVMAPIGVVCGGINLEYYFSRVDNLKLGCGTKLPHNVTGLIGVTNSSDGDLRPGLPWQMIEPHDPVRLMVIVEHFPEIVLKVIQTTPAMFEWYKNEWIHIVAIHPETKKFYYLINEQFVLQSVADVKIKSIDNPLRFFETAPEMKTNHIVDATNENLSVYTLENTK
jgi:uncharacterized protein YbcC (UPF0753/DUF2309 family)